MRLSCEGSSDRDRDRDNSLEAKEFNALVRTRARRTKAINWLKLRRPWSDMLQVCVCGGEEEGRGDRFQRRFTQTSPVSQRSMFLSTRIHDHTQQIFPDSPYWVPDLLHTDIAHTCCISFFFFTKDHQIPSQLPELWRSHPVQVDKFDSSVLVFHSDCSFHFDENNQVFDGRFVHSNSTCRCCYGIYRLYRCSCHCCSRDFT